MKIDTNLRAAIRSTCKLSKRADQGSRAAVAAEAVKKFIAKDPTRWKRRVEALMAANAVSNKAAEKTQRLRQEFEQAGLSPWILPRIQLGNAESFIKAGGELPAFTVANNPDAIIAQLAAATPKDGAEILKGLGIKWEN